MFKLRTRCVNHQSTDESNKGNYNRQMETKGNWETLGYTYSRKKNTKHFRNETNCERTANELIRTAPKYENPYIHKIFI